MEWVERTRFLHIKARSQAAPRSRGSTCSERIQPGHQTGSLLPGFSFASRSFEFKVLQRFPLRLQIGASVDVGTVQAGCLSQSFTTATSTPLSIRWTSAV